MQPRTVVRGCFFIFSLIQFAQKDIHPLDDISTLKHQ